MHNECINPMAYATLQPRVMPVLSSFNKPKTIREKMRFSIGLFVFAILIVLSYTNGFVKMEWLSHGWNVPSFIIVVIPAIVLSICVASWKTVKTCLVVLFSGNSPISASEIKKIKIFLRAFGDTALLIGILATLIAIAQICIVPSQLNNLGPNVSESLTTLVYGLIIKIVTHVAKLRVDYTVD